MTADKVTLRLNAVATYKIADPLVVVTAVEDYRQALYRWLRDLKRAGGTAGSEALSPQELETLKALGYVS